MSDADKKRTRQNIGVVLFITLMYFVLMGLPNSNGSATQDEAITYPIVVKMLDFDPDPHITLGRLIIYGDYHYGYLFYLSSFLVLLPMRLILGPEYIQQFALMMFLLRMFISVLPMLVAILLLVQMQTGFRNLWGSLGMTVFLLAVPAVVRQNIAWWHPDALAILCVVLTIYFLNRDRLRFGRFFWLAAATCGLATAIKLLGVWFVLTIPAYLIAGWTQKQIKVGRVFLLGLGFTAVMAAVTVLSNPFVFYESPRQRMIEIQTYKTQELKYGYSHDDPYYYQHGPVFWEWTLKNRFGPLALLLALLGGLAAGALWGERRFVNRVILSWCMPLGVYLLWFVAPKPDHYILPVMLPLFSGGLGSLGLLWDAARESKRGWLRWLAWIGLAAAVIVLVAVLVTNYLPTDRRFWLEHWLVERG
ncbi:MAG: DUF2029 domain-containing protein [Anaerolineaceae bacterium]|nr:DUF2029 domain-containing protein [Anaerolineaceae bacterium]